MFLSTTHLLIVCLMVLVNCLLNAFAICLCVVAVLLLKEIVLLLVWVVFLFPSPCIVLHSVCVFCLWSYLLFRCSFHIFVLCFCMREVISKFKPFSVRSHGLLVRVVSLSVIDSTIWQVALLPVFVVHYMTGGFNVNKYFVPIIWPVVHSDLLFMRSMWKRIEFFKERKTHKHTLN